MAVVYDLTFTSEIDPQLFVNKVTHYYLEGRYVLIDVIAWPVDVGVHGEKISRFGQVVLANLSLETNKFLQFLVKESGANIYLGR